jgi:hypothetical protein
MRPARIVALVFGALFAIASIGLGAGGTALVWAHATQRDDNGYYNSPTRSFARDSFAITSTRLDLGDGRGKADWSPIDSIGRARIQATRADGGEVFVGIGPERDVEAYLRSSAHDELTDVQGVPFVPTYRHRVGEQRPAPPAAQDFWVAEASGPGRQTATWDLRDGAWSVVVMNADASPGVDVDVRAGLATGWLLGIGFGLLVGAAVSAVLAIVLLVVALAAGPGITPRAPAHASVTTGLGRYPMRLDGHLDPGLSRWLWLVKWFLAIPHLIVLGLLWPLAAVATVAAGIAILFTGTYPRGLFDFNVGVMRWSWRVTFYAFALGTDRYPPFSLGAEPGYPAHLDVTYPTELSRPMVLVKWLLALPHYLIIGIFGGTVSWWTWQWAGDNSGRFALGGGLVSLLVVIAAVILLFTGRYPTTIFDLVMGMERWTYRVFAYVGLFPDEYPPFRLDTGGGESYEMPDRPPAPDLDPQRATL